MPWTKPLAGTTWTSWDGDEKETLNVLGNPYPVPCRLDGGRLQHRAHPHGNLIGREEEYKMVIWVVALSVMLVVLVAYAVCFLVFWGRW